MINILAFAPIRSDVSLDTSSTLRFEERTISP